MMENEKTDPVAKSALIMTPDKYKNPYTYLKLKIKFFNPK